MYIERQHFLTGWQRSLRAFCLGLIVAQTVAFVAAETGLSWLPFGRVIHLFILLIAGLSFGFLWQSGLTLRVDTGGLSVRFWPWQWRFQYIHWSEIYRLRLLPIDETIPGLRFGAPARDFTHIYWLTSPGLRVLCIELVNHNRLFISTERPAELLDFLQHGVLRAGSKHAVHSR
jgi:hypothetical protein